MLLPPPQQKCNAIAGTGAGSFDSERDRHWRFSRNANNSGSLQHSVSGSDLTAVLTSSSTNCCFASPWLTSSNSAPSSMMRQKKVASSGPAPELRLQARFEYFSFIFSFGKIAVANGAR
jgi:hypothetical protein